MFVEPTGRSGSFVRAGVTLGFAWSLVIKHGATAARPDQLRRCKGCKGSWVSTGRTLCAPPGHGPVPP
jgi:hypothetical protein